MALTISPDDLVAKYEKKRKDAIQTGTLTYNGSPKQGTAKSVASTTSGRAANALATAAVRGSAQQNARSKTAVNSLVQSSLQQQTKKQIASDLSPQTQKKEQTQAKAASTKAATVTAAPTSQPQTSTPSTQKTTQTPENSTLSSSNKYLEPGTLLSGATTPKEQQQQAQAVKNAESAQKSAAVEPSNGTSLQDIVNLFWKKAGDVKTTAQTAAENHISGTSTTPVEVQAAQAAAEASKPTTDVYSPRAAKAAASDDEEMAQRVAAIRYMTEHPVETSAENWDAYLKLAQQTTFSATDKIELKTGSELLSRAADVLESNGNLSDADKQTVANYRALSQRLYLLSFLSSAGNAFTSGEANSVVGKLYTAEYNLINKLTANKVSQGAQSVTNTLSDYINRIFGKTSDGTGTVSPSSDVQAILDTNPSQSSTEIAQSSNPFIYGATKQAVDMATLMGATGLASSGISDIAGTALSGVAKSRLATVAGFGAFSAAQSAENQIWDEDSWNANEEAKAQQAAQNGETYTPKSYSVWRNIGNVVLDTATSVFGVTLGGAVAKEAGSAILSSLADSGLSVNGMKAVVAIGSGAGFGITTGTVDQISSAIRGGDWNWSDFSKETIVNMIFYAASSYSAAAGSYTENYRAARKYFTEADMSSPESLDASYKTLAKQYHPDVSSDPNATQIMAEINSAYQSALRYIGTNISSKYTAQKNQNADTTQTEKEAVQLLNDFAESGAEPETAKTQEPAAQANTERNAVVPSEQTGSIPQTEPVNQMVPVTSQTSQNAPVIAQNIGNEITPAASSITSTEEFNAPSVTQNPTAQESGAETPASAQSSELGAANAGFDAFSNWQNQTSKFQPVNEQAASVTLENQGRAPVDVPVTNTEGKLTSKHAATLANANITTNDMASALEQELANGNFSRMAYTDEQADAAATERITKNGWEASYGEYKADVTAGKSSKDITATGIALYNNAVNSNDLLSAMDIASLMIENAKSTAQALQAMRMINKATPEGRLYMAVQSIENIQEQLVERYGKRAPDLTIDQTLLTEYRNSLVNGDKTEQKAAWTKVMQNVADQIPSTLVDKLTAFRYLSMLGNLRTHLKNLASNIAFTPFRLIKNSISTGLESSLDKLLKTFTGKGIERTRAPLSVFSESDRILMKAGWADFASVEDAVQSGGKYWDNTGDLENLRTIFKSKYKIVNAAFKPLEYLRRLNSWALDKEDTFTSRPAYSAALAGYLKANGYSAVDFVGGTMSDAEVAKARNYAISEAAKATFRDLNAFSNWVSRLGRYPENDFFSKAASTSANVVVPFRRTPANYIVRGVEYSPVGLANGIYQTIKSVKNGGTDAASALDKLSAGLTGLGVFALGMLLGGFGLISGGRSDDDKQNDFTSAQGFQNYALNVGNKSYTIDSYGPEMMALLTGVALQNILSDKQGLTFSDAVTVTDSITDPMLETSMLLSLNNLLSSVSYARTSGAYSNAMVAYLTSNYLMQFLPTLGGQIERSATGTRQETYRYNDSQLDSTAQYELGTAFNKIPGVDYGQIPYVDVWGRETNTGTGTQRIINNFLNPSYVSQINTTSVDKEIQRLYDAGYSDVIPTRVEQSTTISEFNNGHMTADEFVQYEKTKGGTSLTLVQQFMDSDEYKGMSDADRAAVIDGIYSYATDQAKKQVVEGRGLSYDSEYSAESDITNIPLYLSLKQAVKTLQSSDGQDTASFDAAYKAYKALGGTKTTDYSTLFTTGKATVTETKSDEQAAISDNIDGFDDLAAAVDAGIDPEKYYSIYAEYKAINKSDETASAKSNDFAYWLDRNGGLSETQKEVLKNNLTYGNWIPTSSETYDSLVGAGLSTKTAQSIVDSVQSLEPEDGKTQVSDVQKFYAIATGSGTDAEKEKAMSVYMDDSQYDDFQTAMDSGIPLNTYVSYLNGVSGYTADKDSNGNTISGSLARKVIQYIGGLSLTSAQKTALASLKYAMSTVNKYKTW